MDLLSVGGDVMENYRKYASFSPHGPVETGHIIRLSDGAVIPFDEENADYIEYSRWVLEGNVPLPPKLNEFGLNVFE